MGVAAGTRAVWVEVDLGAIRANVATLAARVAPAALVAVVKADGYGHGAVPAARAALEGGAQWLAVAVPEEGAELRNADIDARILVLSEPTGASAPSLIANNLTSVVYSYAGIEAVAKAAAELGCRHWPVHLKVDTGMHRVGCAPDAALDLAQAIAARNELFLEGLCTHFAVADEPGHEYTDQQLARFLQIQAVLARHDLRPALVHAANSAAVLHRPDAHFDLVRAGISIYGIAPSAALHGAAPLVPAISVKAKVSHVKELAAGERVSYGLRYAMPRDGWVAVVPVGYADGVRRDYGLTGGEVLIGGVRHRVAGVVTMDQTIVDVGDAPVAVGDEVVLIGRQGDECITVDEWATRLSTIPYEVVCGIGPRVPRRYL
ncbi:MAG: alanine racemase [Acidimicrobiia bacterium]